MTPLPSEEKEEGRFYAALVNGEHFEAGCRCPHCGSDGFFNKMGEFDDDGGESFTDFMLGDIMTCEVCSGVVISVVYPMLDISKPVFLDWQLLTPGEDLLDQSDVTMGVSTTP